VPTWEGILAPHVKYILVCGGGAALCQVTLTTGYCYDCPEDKREDYHRDTHIYRFKVAFCVCVFAILFLCCVLLLLGLVSRVLSQEIGSEERP